MERCDPRRVVTHSFTHGSQSNQSTNQPSPDHESVKHPVDQINQKTPSPSEQANPGEEELVAGVSPLFSPEKQNPNKQQTQLWITAPLTHPCPS